MCVHYKSIFSDGPYISKAYPMACLCLWQISPMLSLTIVQDEHLIGFYAFDFDRGRCTDSRLEKLRGKAWSIPWDTIALESWGGQCGVVFLWYVCVVGVQATWAHCHQVFHFHPSIEFQPIHSIFMHVHTFVPRVCCRALLLWLAAHVCVHSYHTCLCGRVVV